MSILNPRFYWNIRDWDGLGPFPEQKDYQSGTWWSIHTKQSNCGKSRKLLGLIYRYWSFLRWNLQQIRQHSFVWTPKALFFEILTKADKALHQTQTTALKNTTIVKMWWIQHDTSVLEAGNRLEALKATSVRQLRRVFKKGHIQFQAVLCSIQVRFENGNHRLFL
jgi:hypothetical protein